MAEFPGEVNSGKKIPPEIHLIQYAINTTCRQIVRSRYHRLDPEKLGAAKAESKSIKERGIIQRSKSSWASPLHMVKKAHGSPVETTGD